MVVLGVVVFAILVSIMVLNWANLNNKKEKSNETVLVVLIIITNLGTISIFILGWFRYKALRVDYTELTVQSSVEEERVNPDQTNIKDDRPEQQGPEETSLISPCLQSSGEDLISKNLQELPFLRIKLFALYFFGLCYIYHCSLFVWNHTIEETNEHRLGIAYNICSILYVFTLFIYFSLFQNRKKENNNVEKFLTLLVLISNVSIWLDTFFSESDFLFRTPSENKTDCNALNLTHSHSKAEEVIEKIDPFLTPAMIEFSLMAIDMLFSMEDKNHNRCNDENKQNVKNKKLCLIFRHLLLISSFVLFAITLAVVLNVFKEEDKVFEIYVSFQLALKCLLLILILGCIIPVFATLTFHFNVGEFVLIISCFGNIVYHTLYCFALSSSGQNGVNVSWADNVISILIAGLQTYFILGIHSPRNFNDQQNGCSTIRDYLNEPIVYFSCSLMSIINFGLWLSDSIGEERHPVFSRIMCEAYGKSTWTVINKLVLPLTIFFRFHTGLDFLKLYWEAFNVSKNSTQSPN